MSAAYLLLYKDVWEHHYVVLLPPLVLLALKRAPLSLWRGIRRAQPKSCEALIPPGGINEKYRQ